MKKTLVWTVSGILAAAFAAAAEIHGTVTDGGKPVGEGVAVKLDCGGASSAAKTDSFGESLYTPDVDFAVIDRADEVARERGVSTAQVGLAWLLHKPGVTAPIVGTTRVEHLEDALAAAELDMADDDMARLEQPYVPHPVLGHG